MKQIGVYQRLLWPVAGVACAIVLILSFFFGSLPGKEHWWGTLLSLPLIPFLPIILGVFLYGVSLIHKALNTYELESKACQLVGDAIRLSSTPGEIKARLISVTKGNTAIGKRVAYALESTDVDTASAIMQLPQPMDVEEDKTFSGLQFWRSALVLIGLLSTVIFFALAFASASKTSPGNMVVTLLMRDLQRALTMTMAGIATSVVLGGMATHLFEIQQNLKLHVDELTALMLPRLLPHYEKGTKEEPGPALVLEKLQDFFREVENWKSGIGTDVDRLAGVLDEHREVLARLPTISLPDSFTNLNTTLSQVSTTIAETRELIERALQILSESRTLDPNNIVKLLAEIRTDSERIKGSQLTLIDKVLPKQTESLEQLNNLNTTLLKVSEGLKQNTEKQEELVKTNRSIQKELSRLNEPRDEQLLGKMQEMVAGINALQMETMRTNESLRMFVSSSPRTPTTSRAPVVSPEHKRPATPKPATPKPVTPKPIIPPRIEEPPKAASVYDTYTPNDDKRSKLRRVKDWFSDRFYSL